MENLLHERAYNLDHFVSSDKEKTNDSNQSVLEAADQLKKKSNHMKLKEFKANENLIKQQIEDLVNQYASPEQGRSPSFGLSRGEHLPEET